MNRRLAGALALMIALWGGAISVADYRSGRARLWISGGVLPLEAQRSATPRWFWAFTVSNALSIALIGLAGLVTVILP